MIFAFFHAPMRDARMNWLPFRPLTYKTKYYELRILYESLRECKYLERPISWDSGHSPTKRQRYT
jgi:hypothetical protein